MWITSPFSLSVFAAFQNLKSSYIFHVYVVLHVLCLSSAYHYCCPRIGIEQFDFLGMWKLIIHHIYYCSFPFSLFWMVFFLTMFHVHILLYVKNIYIYFFGFLFRWESLNYGIWFIMILKGNSRHVNCRQFLALYSMKILTLGGNIIYSNHYIFQSENL